MSDAVVEGLIFDLVRWLASQERTYEEAMAAWRTSCPRLPVWEDASDRGLITRVQVEGRTLVQVTSAGFALLEQQNIRRQAGHLKPDE